MDISPSVRDALLDILKTNHDSTIPTECEVVFRAPNKSGFKTAEFESVVKTLRSNYPLTIEESLTISLETSQIRFTINGNEQIKQYCKTNKISKEMEHDTVIEKKKKLKQVVVEDYNFRVNLKEETPLSFETNAVRRLLRDWDSLEKIFIITV